MKWFVILGVLTGAYMLMLTHSVDMVMTQTQNLNASYQYVAQNADQIATGQPAGE